MIFAHDTEVALAGVAALVNTRPGRLDQEELGTPADLADYLIEWQWSGTRIGDEAELAAVHRLRDELALWWDQDRDAAADLVNTLLRRYRALPQLVRHDHWDYHLHATPSNAPVADRMAVEAAMAMVDVIRTDELSRLRHCAADDCSGVLVDLSRNRSRRFCSTACSNRVNVAAFRARQS